MSTTPMNVVFASDKSYAEHLAVALYSLFENNPGVVLSTYIINADIDKPTWVRLLAIANRFGNDLIDVKISDREVEGLVTPHHLTKQTYYRLFIPEKVQGSKALYLDADIAVTAPIGDLYATNIDDCYLAAVVTPGFQQHRDLEMSEDSKYFNAGVMLINLAKWRQDHIKERVIEVVREKPWAIQFADQCGLNSVVNGRWKELHPKFNLQGCLFETGPATYSGFFPDGELDAAIQSPVIVHYSGSVKPWHFYYRHSFRTLYWKYQRKTPFRRWRSKDFTILKVIKLCIPGAVRDAVKRRVQHG